MPAFVVSHTNAQIKMAARVRRLIEEHGLSIAAACRAAGIGRRWYYRHRDLIGPCEPGRPRKAG